MSLYRSLGWLLNRQARSATMKRFDLLVRDPVTGNVDRADLHKAMAYVVKADNGLAPQDQLDAIQSVLESAVEVLTDDGQVEDADHAMEVLNDIIAGVDPDEIKEKAALHPLLYAAQQDFFTELIKVAAVACHDRPAVLEKLATLRPELFKRRHQELDDEDDDEKDNEDQAGDGILRMPDGTEMVQLHPPMNTVGGSGAPTSTSDQYPDDHWARRTGANFGFPNSETTDPAWGTNGKKRGPRVMSAEDAAINKALIETYQRNTAALAAERLALQKRLGYVDVERRAGPRVVESVPGQTYFPDPYSGVSKQKGPRVARPGTRRGH